MGVEKNIVAIELGSSSIRAIIGQKKPDGSLQVSGYEKEVAPDSIHKGAVYNIDKTAQAIMSVIKRIEERQKLVVNLVYVGLSGLSLRTAGNSVKRQFEAKTTVSDEILEQLKEENLSRSYPGAEILDVIPQEYRVGAHVNSDPKGVITDRIEGFYKNVIARTSLRENIQNCFKNVKQVEVADFFISPLLLAGYLLTDTEKRSGCALVDFGAETTTVAIYVQKILRHLVVIPLGGNNITNDIASSLHIDNEEAETLKRTYGSAYTEEEELQQPKLLNISNERTVEEKVLLNIIEARQQEIIDNVWEQIKDYSDKLLSGIIFTGGAANIRNLQTAFVQYHHFDKIKLRPMPASLEYTTSLKLDPQTNTLATLIAMLKRGDQECTSTKTKTDSDLFTENDGETSAEANNSSAAGTDNVGAPTVTTTATGDGVVRPKEDPVETEAAKTDVVEEQAPVPEAVPEEPAKPKKPNAFSRFLKSIKTTAEKLVEDN